MPAKTKKKELTPEEKRRERNRRYYEKNKEKLRAQQARRYRSLSADMRARELFRSARYRSQGLTAAVPPWNDFEEACRIYIAAGIMTDLTGEKYVVDHLVPVGHPLVCGLHCHTNLNVISERENHIKRNYFWPQMPAITWDSARALGLA